MIPAFGETIVVWFSCGAASAVAAQETLRRYRNTCVVRVVNNPVAEEDEDNRRYLHDVETWLGVEVEIATNSRYPDCSAQTVWDHRSFMSGPHGAPCTIELKKKARQEWESNNHADWHVLGFTADERARYERFVLTERENVLSVLIDANISKQDCYDILQAAGVELPLMYRLGYPNANCIGCVKATSPTYWNHVRRVHPGVFESRAQTSRNIGAKLVRYRGERIFLDQLPENAVGRDMKNTLPDCGIFCEEWEQPEQGEDDDGR